MKSRPQKMARQSNSSSFGSGTKRKTPILSSSNKKKTNQKLDSSFLAKLQMLREFLGSDSAFDESDLSSCLRQCGYNVELAAEQLMTGQYKASPKGTTTSSFFSSQPQQQTPSTKNHTSSSAPNTDTKRPRVEQITPSPMSLSSSSSTPLRTISTTSPGSSTVAHNRNRDEQQSQQQHLLLCHRWLVGLSTTRAKYVAYKEHLELTSSQSGPPMVRFRGSSLEGTLPLNLCNMLAPLLRVANLTTEASSNNKTPLVSISAEALMEERNIPIGGEVPLSLSVYIEDPQAFFALFETANDKDTASKSADWLGQKQQQKSKKKLRLAPMAEAAFALLQWAEHGDVFQFEPPMPSGNNNDTKSKGNEKPSRVEDDEDDEDRIIVLREDEFETEESLSQTNTNSSQQGDDPSNNNSTEHRPEWADSIVDGGGDRKLDINASLPEAIEPEGLRSHGVTLRPYQRQALHWMMKRENDTTCLQPELELLSELSSSKNTHTTTASSSSSTPTGYNNAGDDDISCECGPVRVSKDSAQRSQSVTALRMGDTANTTQPPVILTANHHPLWQQRFLAMPGMKETASFFVNDLVGVASGQPPNPPRQCVGGLLADAMGLGKTVMLLSLMLKDKEEYDDKHKHEEQRTRCGKTLVVAPLSLIAQWEEELATKTPLSHKVFYGDTARGTAASFVGTDVVITTYGTVQQAYISSLKGKASSSSLLSSAAILSHSWRRVILDEAHCIKNPQTAVSKACCILTAERRWCITGTPIQNSLQDVYGLLKFLKHEPWCEGGFWKAAISSAMATTNSPEPVTDYSESDTDDPLNANIGLTIAIDRVRRLLAPLILRRTKDTLSKDGKPILTLPPVETKIVAVEFSNAEREFYNSLLEKSQSVFDGLIKKGTANKSWFAIFSLLQRLRQACDHVALTVKAQLDQSQWTATTPSRSSAPFEEPGDSFTPEKATKPQADDNSSDDAFNDLFLESLLTKFRSKQIPSKQEGDYPSVDKENVAAYSKQVAHSLSQAIKSEATNVEEECPICLDKPRFDNAVITPCAHIFCRDCLVNFLRENATKTHPSSRNKNLQSSLHCPDGTCPCCNTMIKASRIIAVSKSSEDGRTTTTYLISDSKDPSILRVKSPSRPVAWAGARHTLENALRGAESSKLSAVVSELDKVWKLDPGSKVIIFSQFLGFLSLLEVSLRNGNIPFNRLDGKMNLKERVAALERFNRAHAVTKDNDNENDNDDGNDSNQQRKGRTGSVLLVSMKAGGVGLNLVAASSVFILDPWWNAAVEDQCINRIHRIGQTADIVRVRKFVVQDSVEERIIELQRRKKDMASDILSDDRNDGDISSSRPTLDDFKLIFGK